MPISFKKKEQSDSIIIESKPQSPEKTESVISSRPTVLIPPNEQVPLNKDSKISYRDKYNKLINEYVNIFI